MKIGITKLLPENIAPPNAKKLAIYKDGTKVCDVDISKMILPNLGMKIYSFGLLSDIHLNKIVGDTNVSIFDGALSYFESQGCSFACVSGDLTNIGFWFESTGEYTTDQFGEYKRICDLHPNFPVYECCGNHESYTKPITENLADLETYTGNGLNYTVSQRNDVFIFVGQSTGSHPMSDEHFVWLKTTLEANKNKRCFVFIHPFVGIGDSGDALGIHHQPLFTYWGTTQKNAFINLMKKYPNAILFHGHSHTDFNCQLTVKNYNYSTALGFKSIHIPSTAYTRKIVDGAYVNDDNGSQGYICDVYENHIVLKGYDFTSSELVPIAQYCIETS